MQGGLEEVQGVGSGSCREEECSFSLGDQERLTSPRGQQLKVQNSTVGQSWTSSLLSPVSLLSSFNKFAERFLYGPCAILDAKDTKQTKSLPHRAHFSGEEMKKQLRKAEKYQEKTKQGVRGRGTASERADSKDYTVRDHLKAEESELGG